MDEAGVLLGILLFYIENLQKSVDQNQGLLQAFASYWPWRNRSFF
jgi:hypothetical protein